MGARAGRGDRPAPASHPPCHIKTEHTTVLSFPSKGGEGRVCVRSGTLTSPHPWPPVSSDTSQFLPPLHSVGQLQPSLNPCYIYGAPTVCQAPLASRTPPRAEGRLGPEARGRKRRRERVVKVLEQSHGDGEPGLQLGWESRAQRSRTCREASLPHTSWGSAQSLDTLPHPGPSVPSSQRAGSFPSLWASAGATLSCVSPRPGTAQESSKPAGWPAAHSTTVPTRAPSSSGPSAPLGPLSRVRPRGLPLSIFGQSVNGAPGHPALPPRREATREGALRMPRQSRPSQAWRRK